MNDLVVFLCLSLVVVANCTTWEVEESGGLLNALANAQPGDTIHMADHNYHGDFEATRSGTADAPITLTGSRNAVLRGDKYAFWLKANYWVLKGFAVHSSLKGIVVEGGNHNLLDDLEVKEITQEGVHFRWGSSDNILQNSYIHHTGQGSPTDQGYGEGVYLGQAVNNWQNGQPDHSDRNQVLYNQIGPNVAAESIDVKEGSCCGIIRGNTFYGPESGQNYADSWMDIKGEDYTIEDNTGYDPSNNGFETNWVGAAGMGGCNNRIVNNHCHGVPSSAKCVANSAGCANTIEGNTNE